MFFGRPLPSIGVLPVLRIAAMATTNRTQGRATTALTLPLALALPLPFPPLVDELRGFPSVCGFVQASPYRQVPFRKYEHTSVFFFLLAARCCGAVCVAERTRCTVAARSFQVEMTDTTLAALAFPTGWLGRSTGSRSVVLFLVALLALRLAFRLAGSRLDRLERGIDCTPLKTTR